MNVILKLLIFCIVLFIYIHVCFYLKTCDDLEVYEIEKFSKDKLEEVCDLRQPTLFNHTIEYLDNLKQDNTSKIYSAFDIKIKNIAKDNEQVPLPLNNAIKLFNTEGVKYISEKNDEFLDETCLIKDYRANDALLRPYMVASCEYDMILGSENSVTPLRYDVNYRNFYAVIEGEVTIKLTPPKNSKYLYLEKNYENFEFRSPINPWDIQECYKKEFEKTQFLEVVLTRGKILFIPAYWWYSFKFEDSKTSIISLKYRTYMNTVSILPSIFKSFLQKQNTKYHIDMGGTPIFPIKNDLTEIPASKSSLLK